MTSTVLTLPSLETDYGGFCKGAYYLQAGLKDDGVKIRNNSIAKTGESWYWGCQNKHCVFEGRACKIGKDFFFDDSIREYRRDSITLIRYRWAFLAKSHVAIKKSRERTCNYRCIFCVLQGRSARVIAKIAPFLEHVAEQPVCSAESRLHILPPLAVVWVETLSSSSWEWFVWPMDWFLL